jgi:hypothetical protein
VSDDEDETARQKRREELDILELKQKLIAMGAPIADFDIKKFVADFLRWNGGRKQ